MRVAVDAAVFGPAELAALDAGTGRAPGGAAAGRVVATGEAAAHLHGQRVLVGPFSACGECGACRRGVPGGCPARLRLGIDVDGALAGEVTVASRWLLPLSGPLEGALPGPEAAALPREAALAYEMLSRAGVAPGETTWWLGGGAIAGFGAQLARARGAVALEIAGDDQRLGPDALLAACRARNVAAGQPGDAPWRVFEVSAQPGWRTRAAALALPGSTLVLASGEATGGRGGGDLGAALERDVTLLSVAGAHPDLLPELAALAVRGELDLAAAIEIHPRAAVAELVARLRRGAAPRVPIVRLSSG